MLHVQIGQTCDLLHVQNVKSYETAGDQAQWQAKTLQGEKWRMFLAVKQQRLVSPVRFAMFTVQCFRLIEICWRVAIYAIYAICKRKWHCTAMSLHVMHGVAWRMATDGPEGGPEQLLSARDLCPHAATPAYCTTRNAMAGEWIKPFRIIQNLKLCKCKTICFYLTLSNWATALILL